MDQWDRSGEGALMKMSSFAALVLLIFSWSIPSNAAAQPGGSAPSTCQRTIEADVVAIDQPLFLNRLGASLPGGMIYALRRDIVAGPHGSEIVAGNAQLAPNRRPRPLVLRVRVGDCLHVKFQNLLSPTALGPSPLTAPCDGINIYPEQTCTREAGVHVMGMDESVVAGTLMDGSFVGANNSSLAAPSQRIEYTLRAPAEGVFLMYSAAADALAGTADGGTSGGGFGGQLSAGLFGSVVVQPRSSEWYRSQITKADLDAATVGRSADGHPKLNYGALRKEADGSCTPILRMVDVLYRINAQGNCAAAGNDLVTYYGDLTALVTGPNAGAFPSTDNAPPFNPNPAAPNRHEPYREFVLHYHDVLTVSTDCTPTPSSPSLACNNAFPGLYSGADTVYVLGNGGEAFAINYGSAGIGSEILANRLGVGPEGGCVECRFEEFFLSSWAVGDPAMLVGHPDGLANNNPPQQVPYQPKTALRTDDEAKYPDDPSNVYHSYIGDRVIFRIVHAGQLVTHLHHLHAHQWLHTPNSDTSTYLDSQLISPGSTFTQEIDYDGSGNRNRTPGDAIFHCHFYPHFAAGMWGLWRNHDVFEGGTDLTLDPTTQWNRALPDGEFLKGTPIPAVVPLPTLAMAPMPARTKICPIDRSWDGNQVLDSNGNCPAADPAKLVGEVAYIARNDFEAGRDPGFPFYIPGIAGQRAPHPPLGYARDTATQPPGQTAFLDGELARNITLAGEVINDHYNAWDFSKDLDKVWAIPLAETGTPLERLAMQVHRTCTRNSVTPEGHAGKYVLNGGPSVPGAPYANPSWGTSGARRCVDLADPPPPMNDPTKPSRIYKAADIQMDVVFNKAGWHFPQQRFETLWQDVQPTFAGRRAPEPLFVRANSGETIEFWQTNLVPAYYELDDFQVRTPTDVIGQHIHLVKFDVTASDGSANGYNYELGSLSPDSVRAKIASIRKAGNCAANAPISFSCPAAKPAPTVFGTPPAGQDWIGAQTTVERWWADPVVDNRGNDRTLRTVFTHDHFSPSTHQQAGLYSGLLVEPKNSAWRIPALPDPGNGPPQIATPMSTRPDGGPTSWAADVLTANPRESYREFALEFQDLQLAYTDQSAHHNVPYPCPPPPPTPGTTPYVCDHNVAPGPNTPVWGWASQSAALNAPGSGSTPVPAAQLVPTIISVGVGVSSMNYRSEPLPLRVASISNHDPNAPAQDLALGYASIPRELASLNTQPPNTQKLFPTDPTSDVKYPGGFVGAESLDPYTPLLRAYANDRVQVRVLVGAHELNHTFAMHGAKWLFEPSDTNSGLVAAQPMGISEHFEMLFTLPPAGRGDQSDYLYQTDANLVAQEDGLWGLLRSYNTSRPDLPPLPNNPPRATATTKACPDDAHHVRFSISAVTAARALPAGGLTYNDRIAGFPLTQPDAILYVPSGNLDASGKLLPGAPIEPLILRAAAGNCIDVTLTNLLDPSETDSNNQPIFNSPTPDQYPGAGMPPIGIFPSARAGLHAQLLEADVTTSDGTRIGKNPDQTAAPKGGTVQYTWYAGKRDGNRFVPAELGVVNLQSADPIEQTLLGAVGALVIEPPAATWSADFGTEAAATVFPPHDLAFREFVGVWQPGINGLGAWQAGSNVFPIGEGLNYRSEPFPLRIATADISSVWSNTAVTPPGPPQTPIFSAASGMPVRFRFVNPGGTSPAGNVSITLAEIFGHHWQEEPWRDHSTLIGRNQDSQSMGGAILGSSHALNLVIDHAGAPGDHLYRNFIASPTFNYAMWGLFRVGPPATDVVVVTAYQPTSSGGAMVSGYVTTDMRTRHYAMGVQLVGRADHASVDQATGAFQLALADQPQSVTVRSANGGEASATLPPVAPAVAATPLATARIARAPGVPAAARSPRLEQIANQTAKYFPRPVNQRPPAR